MTWCAAVGTDLRRAELWHDALAGDIDASVALRHAGVTDPNQAQRWLSSGSVEDAQRWMDAGLLDPEAAAALSGAAGSPEAGLRWHLVRASPEVVTAWTVAGFDARDGTDWFGQSFAPMAAREWVDSGVQRPADASRWRLLDIEPVRLHDLATLGIGLDDLTRARRMGVDPNDFIAGSALERLDFTVHEGFACTEIEALSPPEADASIDRLARFAASTGTSTIAVRHGAARLTVELMDAVPHARHVRGFAKVHLWRSLRIGFATIAGVVHADAARDLDGATTLLVLPHTLPPRHPERIAVELLDG